MLRIGNQIDGDIPIKIDIAGDAISDSGAGAFILSNNKGGFILIRPSLNSRYDGQFAVNSSGEVFHFLESIEHEEPVRGIVNRLCRVDLMYGSFEESFSMPRGIDALYYTASKEVSFRIVLDCRHAYDMREWGRNYRVDPLPQGWLISYSKTDDPREDNSQFGEYSLFVAIHCPGGSMVFDDKWIERDYLEDAKRNSPPFKRYVYSPGIIKAKSFVAGVGFSSASAISSALNAWRIRHEISDNNLKRVESYRSLIPCIDHRLSLAYACACNSLSSLVVSGKGIYAGLPWFFQFWARDSAVSCKALSMIGEKRIAKHVLLSQVKAVDKGANLPVFSSPASKPSPALDGVLWTYVRIAEMIKKNPKWLTTAEKNIVASKLKETIAYLESEVSEGLIRNAPKETWMDTEFNGDCRAGFRIEMQCLAVSAIQLAELLKIPWPLLKKIKSNIKKSFWNGSYLNDGKDDPTIRPNVFIAAYLMPDLLSKKEWASCFDSILPKLWLDWGGLSSIAKDHPLFTPESTGENVQSYHRGDSWFWINNMAAIVLHRTDKVRYKKYIDTILEASTKEILFMGASGSHAEISSASHLSSKGCLSQAWSAAMYIEMMDELYGGL